MATAMREFRAAMEAGDSRGAGGLAILHANGWGTEQNPREALRLARIGGDAGDVSAMNLAAEILIRGQGVPRDIAGARDWAKRSAAKGDATGQFLVYQALMFDPQNVPYQDGKPVSDQRYFEMAKRTLSERQEEILAHESLARAADQMQLSALSALLGYYADKIGPSNHAKGAELLARVPNLRDPINYGKWLQQMRELGNTRASPATVRNAQLSARQVVAVKAKADCKDIRLQKLEVSSDIRSPKFLPLEHPSLKDTYLIAGDWDEVWTYSACGTPVALNATFGADGFSGAHFAFKAR